MSAAHTPGPWSVVTKPHIAGVHPDFPYLDYLTIQSAGYDMVAPDGLCICGYMKPADARLLAAAPDLLEALNDALCALEVCGKDYDYAMSKARAAIAKAVQP